MTECTAGKSHGLSILTLGSRGFPAALTRALENVEAQFPSKLQSLWGFPERGGNIANFLPLPPGSSIMPNVFQHTPTNAKSSLCSGLRFTPSWHALGLRRRRKSIFFTQRTLAETGPSAKRWG